ncbi:MAG: N-acetyltransferase [Pseudomonadales bacterium]|nr:N-acetyltransferase [Pseudomonadales bacterium]
MTTFSIRPECPADKDAIYAINVAAFPEDDEARLVNTLRDQATEIISLVAEQEGRIVGHLLLSPASLDAAPQLKLMGLAPMAVLPEFQSQGVGSKLVEAGLKCCADAGVSAVIVLGHPEYYPRFGFVPSITYGIKGEYDVPAEVFMIKELIPQSLHNLSGTVSYHPAFASL